MATKDVVKLNTEIRSLEKALAQSAAEYSVSLTRRTRLEQDTKTALAEVNDLATQHVIQGKQLPGGETALASVGGMVDSTAVEAAAKAKAAGEAPKLFAVNTPSGPKRILLRKPPPPSSPRPSEAPEENVTSDDIGQAGNVADAEDAISDRLARLAADREHLMRRLARLDKREESMQRVLGYTQRRQSQG